MSELQVGMLALVVKTESGQLEENIGKIGQVLAVDSDDLGCEIHLSCDDMVVFVDGEFKRAKSGWFCKSQLLAIKPEADRLDVTHKEELHA